MIVQEMQTYLKSVLQTKFKDIPLISKEDAAPLPPSPYIQIELTLDNSSRYRPIDMRLVFVSESLTCQWKGSQWQRSWTRCSRG